MGVYTIKTTPEVIKIKLSGQFTADEIKNYVEDFRKEAKKVNPATCKLDFDSTEMKVFSNESQQALAAVVKSYKTEYGFDDLTLRTEDNAMLKMQCKIVGMKVGFKHFQIL